MVNITVIDKTMPVGSIGNYYGGLHIAEKEGKFYWGIENYDGTYWEEIPESLYSSIASYEHNKTGAEPKTELERESDDD